MENPFVQNGSQYLWQLIESVVGQRCRIVYRNSDMQLNAVHATPVEIRKPHLIVENNTGDRFRLPIGSIDQIQRDV